MPGILGPITRTSQAEEVSPAARPRAERAAADEAPQ